MVREVRRITFAGSVFEDNLVSGFPVGIHIRKDSGMAIGAGLPPEFEKLRR